MCSKLKKTAQNVQLRRVSVNTQQFTVHSLLILLAVILHDQLLYQYQVAEIVRTRDTASNNCVMECGMDSAGSELGPWQVLVNSEINRMSYAECTKVSFCRCLQTLRRKILPPSSDGFRISTKGTERIDCPSDRRLHQ